MTRRWYAFCSVAAVSSTVAWASVLGMAPGEERPTARNGRYGDFVGNKLLFDDGRVSAEGLARLLGSVRDDRDAVCLLRALNTLPLAPEAARSLWLPWALGAVAGAYLLVRRMAKAQNGS